MQAPDLRRVSLEEYIALDRAGEERWEYVNGEATVMSASPEHNVVKGNLYAALRHALMGKRCLVLPDGQKVSTPRTRAYHYPDASVFCAEPRRDQDDDHALTNPTLLAEVLSPTTADCDRGGKFVHYRTLKTLEEYLVVSIDDRLVERYRRLDSGEWLMTEIRGGQVELTSIGARFALEALWVDLERLGPA